MQFINETTNILKAPSRFFASKQEERKMDAVFALVYSVLAGILVWLLHFSRMDISQGLLNILAVAATGMMVWLAGSVLLFLLAWLLQKKHSLARMMSLASPLMVFFPFSILLGNIFRMHALFARGLNLLLSLYFLWVLYHLLVSGISLENKKARLVIAALGIFLVLQLILL